MAANKLPPTNPHAVTVPSGAHISLEDAAEVVSLFLVYMGQNPPAGKPGATEAEATQHEALTGFVNGLLQAWATGLRDQAPAAMAMLANVYTREAN